MKLIILALNLASMSESARPSRVPVWSEYGHSLQNQASIQRFGEILPICSQDIKQKENMMSIKGDNFVTNKQKMKGNSSNLDLLNINAYIKIGVFLLIFL